jgi:hypothetical protein
MKRATMRLALAALFLVLQPVFSNSQTIRMGGYLHPKNVQEEVWYKMYVAGLKDGLMFYMAAELKLNPAAKRLFCFPDNLSLTTEQAEDIIKRWAQLHSTPDSDPIGFSLLYGLAQNFPCQR